MRCADVLLSFARVVEVTDKRFYGAVRRARPHFGPWVSTILVGAQVSLHSSFLPSDRIGPDRPPGAQAGVALNQRPDRGSGDHCAFEWTDDGAVVWVSSTSGR